MKSQIGRVSLFLAILVVAGGMYYLLTTEIDGFTAKTGACVESGSIECEELSKSVDDLVSKPLMGLSDPVVENLSIITLENALIPNSKNERLRLVAPQEKGEIATTQIRQ